MAIVGTHERSLDDKGRLVLPARFRSHFSGVVYLSPGDGCISLWPSERFDSMVASVEEKIRSAIGSDEPVTMTRTTVDGVQYFSFLVHEPMEPAGLHIHLGLGQNTLLVGSGPDLPTVAKPWFKEGSIDYVVGQDGDAVTDTGIQAPWLPAAAKAAGGAAYFRPPRRIYDERVGLPSIEMYRALGQNLLVQGYAGMYHGYLPWPLSTREYEILREVAFPEVQVRRDKRYLLAPCEGAMDEPTTTPQRQLPIDLEEGATRTLRPVKGPVGIP